MYNFYTMTLLNKSKTKFTVIGNKSNVSLTKNLKVRIGNDTISCDGNVRILGTLISADNSLESAVNELVSNLNFRLLNLLKIKKLTTFKTRLNFINSFVIGRLNYVLPIFLAAPGYLVHKLHLIQIKAAKLAVGNGYFRKSNKYLLDKCGWLNVSSLIEFSSICFIHKVIYYQRPSNIYDLFKMPSRAAKNIVPFENLSTKHTRNFFIYKSLVLFNNLKNEVKSMQPLKFRIKLRKLM